MNEKIKIIELPKHYDPRGSLTVSEEIINIPFHIASTEWFYGIRSDSPILNCTYQNAKVFIVALSGSFRIKLSYKQQERSFFPNRPNMGLFIDKGVGIKITDCANGTVILMMTDKLAQARIVLKQLAD